MRADNKIHEKFRYRVQAIAGLVMIIPVSLLIAGCSKKEAAQEIPPRPVKVATAFTKDVPIYIDTFGNLASPNNVDIICQVTGKVKEVHFKEGYEVKVGDPLFTIDPKEYEAELAKSQAALAADKVDAKLKEETFERNKKLIEEIDLPAGF